MPPKKKIRKTENAIPYIEGFILPNEEDKIEALGSFPFDTTTDGSAAKHREDSLLKAAFLSSTAKQEVKGKGKRKIETGDNGNENLLSVTSESLKDIDIKEFYHNQDINENSVWKDLPHPIDDQAWLVHNNEDGQTFNDYRAYVTLRSGKFKPNANVLNDIIYIVPIVRSSTAVDGSKKLVWPETGPQMDHICAWVSSFYNRRVICMDAVKVEVANSIPKNLKVAKKNCISFRTPHFESFIEGRVSKTNKSRFQIHIDGLLGELAGMRDDAVHTYDKKDSINMKNIFGSDPLTNDDNGSTPSSNSTNSSGNSNISNSITVHNAFALIGITMEDIYSHDTDLFVAGMAAGGSKVAVLSFFRYHPHIRMSPMDWDDYGYAERSSNYSYFEDGKKRPKTSAVLPILSANSSSSIEYLRRSGKLLIHELAHVYAIDHCIHYHCLMNGTGHLVEDFASPSMLCGVCLRKLQFRLGFCIKKRYKNLLTCMETFDMKPEAKWYTSRLLINPSAGETIEETTEEKDVVVINRTKIPASASKVSLKKKG